MNSVVKYCIIILITVVGFSHYGFSQITIRNPSFELNGRELDIELPIGWDSCGWNNPFGVYKVIEPHTPPSPPDGLFYLDLESESSSSSSNPPDSSVLATKLSCPVFKGMNHAMSVWGMGYFQHTTNAWGYGYFEFFLGYSKCDLAQKIFHSPLMIDTSEWTKYNFSFIPNDNYEYLIVKGITAQPNSSVDIFVDDISPIFVEVPNQTKISIDNINKHGCYSLSTQINSSVSPVRYEWKQDGNTISNQSSVSNICVSSSSQIVFIAYDACGYGYVDTLVLQHGGINANISSNGKTLHLQMNDATENTTFALFNSLGQLLQTQTIVPNTTSFDIDIAALPSGVYFSTLQTNYGWLVKKFIKE